MIIYQEKASKKSFIPLGIFCAVFIGLAIYMGAPLEFFLIPLGIIIAIFSLIILGSEFRLEDELIFMKILFIPKKILYKDIAKIESAQKYISRGLSLNVNGLQLLGQSNKNRMEEIQVITESGQIFKPDEYSSSSNQGFVLFMKTGRRVYITAKEPEKVIAIIKGKLK